ncbi:MAG: VanW family protein [Clostridia bacterium]|nr:VanW family protein [Clostridia bacterium]
MKFLCIYIFAILTFLLVGCENKENDNIVGLRNNAQDYSSYDVDRLNLDKERLRPEDTDNIASDNLNSNESTSVDSKVEIVEDTQFDENANISLLSTYSTEILTDDDNRYNNIKIVADRLNNYVLEPGEEFSFNNVCGPYGKDDGFLEATILLSNGEEDKGYGGGVCQLSSTLYNAVNALDLEITEHHHHSSPVAYVPKNQDATVSLQSNLDFKFKNSFDYPIKFRTSHDPNNLTVFIDRI